jgi:hypothetical protein
VAGRRNIHAGRLGIIDSQSVKGAGTVTRNSRGYDAGKKINGRKRFIVTGTLGLLIVVVVLAASVQDRDGAKTTLPLCASCANLKAGRASPSSLAAGPSNAPSPG